MADSVDITGHLSNHRGIRGAKYDKKKQNGSGSWSKTATQSKDSKNNDNLYKPINSNSTNLEEIINLDISEYDNSKNTLTSENKELEINESSDTALRSGNDGMLLQNVNKLNIPGFNYDEQMNILVIKEDDKLDNNSRQDEVTDQEKVNLEKDESMIKVKSDTTSLPSPTFNVKNHLEHKVHSVLIDSDNKDMIKQSLDCIDVYTDAVNNKDTIEYKGENHEQEEIGQDKNELMKILLSQRHFKVKPTDAVIYMEIKSQWHPRSVDDIPWKWLREEKWRLHTYSRYPHGANKSAILLAEDGFVYLGSGRGSDDKVICHFCLVIKQQWKESDIIPRVHQELSPDCSMVTKVNCNNVAMTVPECGLSLFGKLNNCTDVLTSEVRGIKAGNEVSSDEIEHDSAQEQYTNQKRPNVPGIAAKNDGNAHFTKPIQMASQTIMRANTSRSQSHRHSTLMTSGSAQSSNTDMRTSAATSNVNATSSSHGAVVTNTSRTTEEQNSGPRSAATTTQQSVPQNAQQQSIPTATVSSATVSSHTNEVSSSHPPNLPATNNSATLSSTSQSTNPQRGQVVSSQTTSEAQNPPRATGRGPTYGELGIITERPKRFEFAMRAKRLESFDPWPRDHHMKKEDLADAGFYYAGYGDCARCFYCGGGLRNWEDNDNVLVEHARWFPKCAFIRQTMGQQFVDAVQDLNRGHDQITFEMVTEKIGVAAVSFQLDTKDMPLKRDPAVITVLDMGFCEKDVFEAANFVKESNGVLSADKLYEKLQLDGKPRTLKEIAADSQSIRSSTDLSRDESVMNQLKEQNNQLRQQTICKICMDKEVAVVFLPCGHLVSCADCAAALRDCPVCRNSVRGIVRAFMA